MGEIGHNKLHDIDATSDHNGVTGATADNFISFDANALPKDSGVASSYVDQDVSSGASPTLDGTNFSGIDHGGLAGLGDDDHTQYSQISSQSGAPSSTPSRIGLINVDTAVPNVYISTGTASSADWTQVN